MSSLLRVLVLIDTVADSNMFARELRRTGFELDWRRATSETAYLAELESPPDVILADNALSEFDAMRALQLLRASDQDIPLIVLADAASEQAAIECVSLGAADFVFKERPARLQSAVARALDQRELREHALAADAALRQSAAINQAVLDSLTAHIAVLNADGVIVAVNQAWERFARANGDAEMQHTNVGSNYLDVCRSSADNSSAEAGAVVQGIAAVLARELDQYALEYSCHSPTEERWFIMRVTPLVGEHTGAVVAHENITERTKVERALRESEGRFRTTFEQAAVGIAHLAPSGQVLRVNTRLCDIFGYSREELLASKIHDLNAPGLVSHAQAGARQLLAREVSSYSGDVHFTRRNNTLVWVEVTVSLVCDDRGAPSYFIALVEDITERKQAEATRALLAALVDSSEDAIIGVGMDGTVMSWNIGAEHVYGYRAAQMIGQPIALLRPPHLQEEVIPLYERLAQGERTTHIETVRLRSDGQLIDVAITLSALNDADGGVSGFSTISRDISARKRDERALRQTTAFVRLLQEVAVAANQATSLEQALQTAIDKICEHIGWPVGHVYLPDPAEPGALLPTHIWHLEDAQRFANFRSITEEVRLAPGIGLPGQVMSGRGSVWVSDMNLDANTPRTRLIKEIGVRSGFALPVLLGDEVAAVLEFFATEAIEPDDALLDVLHHVGTQLGRVVERARAEAAVRESAERFRVLFEHSPDAIILIDPHDPEVSWPIVECNDVACQMNGHTRAELIGQSIDLLNVRPGSRAERAQYIERLRREGTLQFQDIHRRKDGSLFPIEVVSSLISIDGHDMILGIDRDISERKRAEDALRTAEARYRTLVEQMPAIIYTAAINENSSTSYVSPQVEAILGFTPEEWLAEPDLWLKQVHPDDRARVLDLVGQVQVSDLSIPAEFRSFTRDGRLVWLRDAARVVRDEAGQPLFLQGISVDITDRKLAEEALTEREAYFRALIENSTDAVALFAADGTILYGSPATPRILGYEMPDYVGRNAFDLIHVDDREQIAQKIGQIVGQHGATTSVWARVQHADGTWRDLEGQLTNLLDDPAVGAIVNNYRDITARKRAEDALRAAEAKYRILVEQMPAIIYTAAINDQGSTTYVSPQIEALLGFTPEEWLADPDLWLQQVHPADRARLLDSIGRVQTSDAAVPTEYRSFTRDGRVIWLRDTERVVRDDAGRPLFMQGITVDITERKLAEEALARYQLLSEHARDIILFLRSDGQIIEANQAALAVYGYSRDELLARSIYDLRPAAAHAEVDARLAQVDDVGILYEATHCHKDGRVFPVEVGSRSVMIGDERVIVSIIRDITERKRAEEALHASERLYRTLASNFPNGAVVLFDHDLRFTIADGAGLGAFGLTREQMEGRTLWEVYGPEHSPEPEEHYRAALAGMPQVRELTMGEQTYVVHTLPVRDEQGEIIAGMLMSQDITERKRIEQALIDERALLARRVDERTADLSAANAELARAAILKDEFLASMSHELRTPLNAVLGLSEALQEEVYGSLNERQRRSLHSIEESGRHLLELINDILDLAKIGAGKLELNLEPAAIASISQASLRLIKQIAHTKQLSVDLTLDPTVTLLTVDARRVKQILVNLLSNAVKFTPAGGAIGLEVVGHAERQAVELTVWDTGIGIAHEQMSQLFQPFVQLDSRLARQYEGTGLGLALVYRMVELHGGSVAVSSEPGRGSRFTVVLPWPAAQAEAQPGASPPPAQAMLDRTSLRRALIVEDSPTSAEQLARYLDELGVASTIVRDGAAVIAQASDERPDLILLDLLLADRSGWDVLAQLKAEPRTRAIPVVIVSVIDERERGLALGAAEYLVKPVARADLQRVLPGLTRQNLARQAAPWATSPRPQEAPLVLLAEDNETTITLLTDYLGTHGYQVVVARNGAEAISRARERQPALVLMDIQLPGMDGLEATRRLRAIESLAELPIIALTALAMPGDRERCLAAGVTEYLSKPVSLQGLALLIEQTLQAQSRPQRSHA